MSDAQEVLPIAIERVSEAAISIAWDDGTRSEWTARRLRDTCPCATCREKRRDEPSDAPASGGERIKTMGLPVISAAEARPLTITAMKPVGNYAYNIVFSDGHSSGLFTFERLRDAD
ncbi:MAG: DUF971 domain-containing protein [Planctomycetota bacterium]